MSFWDVGGDSLKALQVLARINSSLGVNLTPDVLLHETSIVELAQRLSSTAKRSGSRSPCLIKFRKGDGGTPLFCVHHHLGTAYCFRELVGELDPRQPVYALQSRGLSGVCHERIEDMAAHYLEEMDAVVSGGPYYLLGYCFGGWVVLEMARQLLARGDKLGLLAMIDLEGPGDLVGGWWARMTHWLSVERTNLAALNNHEKRVYVHNRVKGSASELARQLGMRGATSTPLPPGRLQSVAAANALAQRLYRAQRVAGELLLFRQPNALVSRYKDPHFGWGQVVDRTEVCFVPGRRMEGPGVKIVAARLTRALETPVRKN